MVWYGNGNYLPFVHTFKNMKPNDGMIMKCSYVPFLSMVIKMPTIILNCNGVLCCSVHRLLWQRIPSIGHYFILVINWLIIKEPLTKTCKRTKSASPQRMLIHICKTNKYKSPSTVALTFVTWWWTS